MVKKKVLLLLPCNSGAERGDYMLGSNWRLIYRDLKDLVDSKRVDMAAADCINNAGIVLRGEESRVKGGNVYPSWDRFKWLRWYKEKSSQTLKEEFIIVALRKRKAYKIIYSIIDGD